MNNPIEFYEKNVLGSSNRGRFSSSRGGGHIGLDSRGEVLPRPLHTAVL